MRFSLPFLSVRAVALMMLLAGAGAGVLLARTLWAEKPDLSAPAPTLDRAIEEKVQLYVRYMHLDARAADRVRRCLTAHDRSVAELYRRLRIEQAGRFQELLDATSSELKAILDEEHAVPPR